MESIETSTVAHDEIDEGYDRVEAEAQAPRRTFFEALKALRPGQWLRIAAVAICLVGLVLYLVLPQIIVGYQRYDNETVGNRVLDGSFPLQLISGINNFFGGTPFVYYKESEYQAVEVLISQTANFTFVALGMFLLALIACGLTLWLNFTKKHEKWAKLVALFYVICGLMAIMGPIWVLAANGFGGADYTPNTDVTNYWNYYELYVHDAYGAIVTGLVILASAVCFGVGTSLEGGDKNDVRNAD